MNVPADISTKVSTFGKRGTGDKIGLDGLRVEETCKNCDTHGSAANTKSEMPIKVREYDSVLKQFFTFPA